MQKYYLNSPGGKIDFLLPDTWRVVNNAVLKAEKVSKSISEMVTEAVGSPLGTPPLSSLLKGKKSVTVIVDDLTRPTPKKAILTALFELFDTSGVRKDQVTVVIGLGTHRPLTGSEIEETFGPSLCRGLRVVNHDCRAPDLVPVGTLRYGGELKIHPAAAAADLLIAVGSILPHPFAGFGGGPKLVLPGIANFEAIRRHHLALMIADGVVLGNCEGNPWRDEIYEAAALAELDFVVNAIFDADEDVKAIVAGDYQEAHPIGAAMCANELGVAYDQTADVTITSAFPYTEGPQILKPLVAATMVTKKGGTLLIYAGGIIGNRFPESLLKAFDVAFSAAAGGDTRQLVIDCLRDGKCVVPNAPMDFNSALNTVLLAQKRIRTLLISPDTDEDQVRRLGFDYVPSLQQAIEMIARDRSSATVNILPSGGLVLPLLADGIRFSW